MSNVKKLCERVINDYGACGKLYDHDDELKLAKALLVAVEAFKFIIERAHPECRCYSDAADALASLEKIAEGGG